MPAPYAAAPPAIAAPTGDRLLTPTSSIALVLGPPAFTAPGSPNTECPNLASNGLESRRSERAGHSVLADKQEHGSPGTFWSMKRPGALAIVLHTDVEGAPDTGRCRRGGWSWRRSRRRTCRCSTCSDGADHAVTDAGPVRPSSRRQAHWKRCVRFLEEIRPESHARTRRVSGVRAGMGGSRARALGDRVRGGGPAAAVARTRRAAADAGEHAELDIGGNPPCACRCSASDAGIALQLGTGIELAPARVRRLGRAASGRPRSARTRRGLTRCWRRPASARRASS